MVPENCTISYVSSAFDVYMVRDTPQRKVVQALVSLLDLRASDAPIVASLVPKSVYLGRSRKHGWCRMKLHSKIPTRVGIVSVRLLDYGDTELVPIDSLRDLQVMSPVLARIPDQAVLVLLNGVLSPTKLFTEKAARKLRKIAPPELSLVVRLLKFENDVPVVELFERLDSDKLVSVIASLEMDETLYRSAESPSKSNANVSLDDVPSPCR